MAHGKLKWRIHRQRYWAGGIAIAVILAILLSAFFVNRGLRHSIEDEMNRHLNGYTAHVGRAKFHPIGFSLDVMDWTISQNAHPDPPVARIPRLHASVHWGQFIRGHVVGDFHFYDPKVYINLANIREEEKSKIPIRKKGWQEALQSIYPLKINYLQFQTGNSPTSTRNPINL